MHRIDRYARLLIVAIMGLATAACAMTPVAPWQRGRLARWDMRWDPDSLQSAMAHHAHFSKEGIDGRVGVAGGGCGCN